MKKIDVKYIRDAVAEMCIEANTVLTDDILKEMEVALAREESPSAISILETMIENFEVAEKKEIPICQDTGMAVIFVTMGQDLQIAGGSLEDAIQDGVEKGYREGYLRKSVVDDPFIRNNTGTNTPAIIHYKVVPGDALQLKVMPKGFGSENTSAMKMLKPSDGIKGVEEFVVETVEKGAPNACAPIIVGVGVGGTFEKAALLAKEALSRPIGVRNARQHIQGLEEILIERCNNLGIGPMGLGGINTVLSVNVDVFPTHIAGLPVAVNICCYVNRHVERTL
ncbi:fumarate hydratase [Eubacterium sp. 1001713B170207_170306_E7]|uniref:fumarate hydratase n=1 Tax=Eubacterium sp. 1001713B170207_170306_E7 TaxID=2787097 RepID=UPI001898298E|nr:fumarate hydratase [Eubacterium sp. 1001713B170207_170306_E7]